MTTAEDAPEPSDLAFGPCAVCGKETQDSPYWSGIGPAATLFTFGHNKPFCSAACSARFTGFAAAGKEDAV